MVDSKDGTGVGEKEQALTGLLIWNLGLNNTASIEACSPQPPELIELPYDADSAGCFNAHAYGAIPSTPERFSRRSSVAKAPVRMQRSRAVSPVSQKAGKKGAGAKKAATTVTKEHHQASGSRRNQPARSLFPAGFRSLFPGEDPALKIDVGRSIEVSDIDEITALQSPDRRYSPKATTALEAARAGWRRLSEAFESDRNDSLHSSTSDSSFDEMKEYFKEEEEDSLKASASATVTASASTSWTTSASASASATQVVGRVNVHGVEHLQLGEPEPELLATEGLEEEAAASEEEEGDDESSSATAAVRKKRSLRSMCEKARTWHGGVGSAKAKRDADACLTKQGSKGRLTWDAAEGPPEVEMKHNGKRNEKGDSWHSMHMVQRLRYHEGSVWALRFNCHGTRIATGGEDGKVIVWSLAVPRQGRYAGGAGTAGVRDKPRAQKYPGRYEAAGVEGLHGGPGGVDGKEDSLTELEVFCSAPSRVYSDHKSDVVDLSWSQSDFLCSASMDRTVKLWHPLSAGCIGTFNHPTFVTSVHFCPGSDHMFVSGSFDKLLRMWTIPEGRVSQWVGCPGIISSVAISPDGQLTSVGLCNGRVMLYRTSNLEYYAQIYCRNRFGRNRRGRKVSGLAFVETLQLKKPGRGVSAGEAAAALFRASRDEEMLDGQISSRYSLLSTTNDSRMRVHDLNSFSMTSKIKGLVNAGGQMKASFSEDGKFVISGSEDGQVFLWDSNKRRRHRKRPSKGSDYSLSPLPFGAAAEPKGFIPERKVVKLRASSSFTVPCSSKTKAVTAAVFFPPASLETVLNHNGVLADDARLCHYSMLPTRAGAAGAGAAGAGAAGARVAGAGGSDSEGKGEGGDLCQTPVIPAQDGEGDREGESGATQSRWRRWSSAGRAWFGKVGIKMAGGHQPQAQRATARATSTANETTPGPAAATATASASPPCSPCSRRTPSGARNSGRSPKSPSRIRRWFGAKKQSQSPQSLFPQSGTDTETEGGGEGSVGGGGRFWRARDRMRAVVSADFSGEIKVFVGLVTSKTSAG